MMDVIPVETLSDHGISASTNVSNLSVAWLIRKLFNGELGKFNYLFYSTSFWESSLG